MRIGRGQKGFILIDSLVGIIILTVALLAILLTYRQATITAVSAKNYNNAVYLAQQAAEELKKNDGRLNVDPKIEKSGTKFIITPTPLTIAEVETNTDLKPYKIMVTWDETINSKVINRTVEIVEYYYLLPTQGGT